MDDVGGLVPRKRKTQGERTAETRSKLIEATIKCLYERGYADTTTMLVVSEAGVSRGAMLHHFPAKLDLIRAVTDVVLAETEALFAQRLDPITDPRERFIAAIDVAWENSRRPGPVAWLEIWLATRNDPQLRDALRDQKINADQRSQIGLREVARSVGVADDGRLQAFHALVDAAFAGIALEIAVHGYQDRFREVVAELRRLAQSLLAAP